MFSEVPKCHSDPDMCSVAWPDYRSSPTRSLNRAIRIGFFVVQNITVVMVVVMIVYHDFTAWAPYRRVSSHPSGYRDFVIVTLLLNRFVETVGSCKFATRSSCNTTSRNQAFSMIQALDASIASSQCCPSLTSSLCKHRKLIL